MSIYDSTLGIILIGALISGVLFGLFTCQVYIYHKTFPEEWRWIKFGLVDGMWLLEMGHTICVFHAVYFYAVTNYGEKEVLLTSIPHSWPAAVFFHGLVAILAQSYFTYRIARFGTRHWYIIPAICSTLMFCQLLGDIAASVFTAKENMQTYLQKHEWLIIGPVVIRSTVDIIISATLVYYLVRQRNSNAYKNTIAVIDKLILWSIETGIVTSMVGIMLMVFYLWNNANYTWVALYMVLPKVFSNTMLANINSRVRLREMQSTMVMTSSFGIRFASMQAGETSRNLQHSAAHGACDSPRTLASELDKVSNVESMA